MNQESTQTAVTPVETETAVQDLQPQEDVKGGIGMLLPAVQKVRSAAAGGG